jgi:hypothetical protein
LASLGIEDSCKYASLSISEEDTKKEYNDLPNFPLVLNNRTSFTSFIWIRRHVKCENFWLEFYYANDKNIDYCGVLKRYNDKKEKWDNNLQFQKRKIKIPKELLGDFSSTLR